MKRLFILITLFSTNNYPMYDEKPVECLTDDDCVKYGIAIYCRKNVLGPGNECAFDKI